MADNGTFLEQALAARWKIYSRLLEECQGKCGSDSLRRLRVAIRRLLSDVEAAQMIFRSRNGRKARLLLKAQLKALGPLRDVQMQICRLEGLQKKYPEARAVLRWLEKRRHKKMQRARRCLRKVDRAELHQALRKVTRKSERFLLKSGSSAEILTRKALEASFQKVESRFAALDAQELETIHSLRIAFKHFRYLVEALKGPTAAGLKPMKRYQARMGEIQDMEVLMCALHTFACRKEKSGSRALVPLRRETRKRRNQAVHVFWRHRHELLRFAPAILARKPSHTLAKRAREAAARMRAGHLL